MKKIFFTILVSFILTTNLYAGCMKSEITQLDTKLKESNISADKKAEVSKLRDIVAKNEHEDSELAFQSYEKALRILDQI